MPRTFKNSAATPGGPSKKSADIKALAQSHGPEALLVMVRLMESKDEKTALAAAREVLLRAAGKVEQASDDESCGIIVIREKLTDIN